MEQEAKLVQLEGKHIFRMFKSSIRDDDWRERHIIKIKSKYTMNPIDKLSDDYIQDDIHVYFEIENPIIRLRDDLGISKTASGMYWHQISLADPINGCTFVCDFVLSKKMVDDKSVGDYKVVGEEWEYCVDCHSESIRFMYDFEDVERKNKCRVRLHSKDRTADWHIEDNTHDSDYKDGDRICRDLVFTHIEPPITYYIFRDC